MHTKDQCQVLGRGEKPNKIREFCIECCKSYRHHPMPEKLTL
jgi:hypothetical protein